MNTKLNVNKRNSILKKMKLHWKVIKKRKSDTSIHFLGRERHVLREHNAQSNEKITKRKTCNNSLHFSGRERNIMREENARSKDKMFNKKTCNTSLHFSGREVNITSHNHAKREIGKEENEVGKLTISSYRPSPNPINPNPKCQNAEREEGKKEENEVGRKTSKTRNSRLTPPPNLTIKIKTQMPKIRKFVLKYLLKARKKSLHNKEKF